MTRKSTMSTRKRNLALCTVLAASAALVSCSSGPKPPMADDSTRRPVNDPARIELLRAQSEIERARVELELQRRQSEVRRMAEEVQGASRGPVRVNARLERGGAATRLPSAGANSVYTAQFAVGSMRLALGPETAGQLIDAAREAPLIVIRGRTDAEYESLADARIARERANAMRTLLLGAGIRPEQIRTTWQAAGDHVASNQTPEGRTLNRRVEVELYAAAPALAQLSPIRPQRTAALQ